MTHFMMPIARLSLCALEHYDEGSGQTIVSPCSIDQQMVPTMAPNVLWPSGIVCPRAEMLVNTDLKGQYNSWYSRLD